MTPGLPLRIRRSVLITPGDDEVLLPKAASSDADVSVIDWEDGVFGARKDVARAVTARMLASQDWRRHEVAVRINGIDTPYGVEDIEASAALPIDGIRLAKVTGVEDVMRTLDILDGAESRQRPSDLAPLLVWVSIETAKALSEVNSIAGCHPRLTALSVGAGDLGADLGVKRLQLGGSREFGPIRYEYLYAESCVVTAARAHGLDPINTGYTSFGDLDGTRQQARFSAQLGFSGCITFSPKQVPVINEAFSASSDDLEWCRAIIAQFEENTRERGRTVSVVRNEMTDGPYVRNARRLLEMEDLVQSRRRPSQ